MNKTFKDEVSDKKIRQAYHVCNNVGRLFCWGCFDEMTKDTEPREREDYELHRCNLVEKCDRCGRLVTIK